MPKQGPRKLKKSVRARNPKYAPKIRIFALYCIFSLQFSKVSEGPGPHGPRTHEILESTFLGLFGGKRKLSFVRVFTQAYRLESFMI